MSKTLELRFRLGASKTKHSLEWDETKELAQVVVAGKLEAVTVRDLTSAFLRLGEKSADA
jgi:hypothetical protein